MDPRDMAPEDRRVLGIWDEPEALDPWDPGPPELTEAELLALLADEIEYDDHRGLKFKERPDLNPLPQYGQPKDNRTVSNKGKRRCPIKTTKGNSCPIVPEPGRPACHVHDPDGKNAKMLGPKFRARMQAQLEALGTT